MAGFSTASLVAERRERRLRARADNLPEYTHYRDDGCDIHPHCLSCPLPRCRYEEPGGLRALLNQRRDSEIVELRRRGVPVAVLADRFGVSRRTVFRILERTAAASSARVVSLRPRAASEARREANCA